MYKRLKEIVIALVLILSMGGSLLAQNDEEIQAALAKEYYYDNQIDKAIEIYEGLVKKRFVKEYYDYLLLSYYQVEANNKAERLIKSTIRRFPDNPIFVAELGTHYFEQGSEKKAEKEYKKAIERLGQNRNDINHLANYFAMRNNINYVVDTYLKGRELLGDNTLFVYEISFQYSRLGKYDELSNEYLNLIKEAPNRLNQAKVYLGSLYSRDESDKVKENLRQNLLKRLQTEPDNKEYAELYLWHNLQEKDFEMALIQANSIDRRFDNGSGKTLFETANILSNNKDYTSASEAYEAIIQKGKDNTYYMLAQKGYLTSLYHSFIENQIKSQEKIQELRLSYEEVIEELGVNPNTFEINYQYAYILAYFLDSSQEAVGLLDEIIENRSINRNRKAEAKLLRADIYLMENDIWEASLTYMQVDKDFKSDIIGSEAKFKNAMLSYYNADFEWANSQFDVLRASTSKLIANDAMKHSLLISDNMDEDSTYNGLYYYAKADFAVFQKKYDKALQYLDTLSQLYLYHPIFDDLLYKRAEIAIIHSEYQKADSLLNQILLKYPDDLKADDALNLLGELYLEEFKDREGAREYYERIILDYPNSLYVTKARKRYNELGKQAEDK